MLKRIVVADLRIGMYVQEFCGSWMDHPFWKSKFLLNSPQDLQRIRASSIGELWIDVSKGLDVEAGAVVSTEAEAQKEVEATLMAAVQPRSTALSASMDTEARMGKALNFEQA